MPKRQPETDHESQAERFKEAARELGVDEADDALDRVMGKLDLKKPEATPPTKEPQSSGKQR